MEQGYRSEVQERALVVSLQMFNLILERGVSLLKSQLDSGKESRMVVSEDMQVLLPAIKVFPLSLAYLMGLYQDLFFRETFTVPGKPRVILIAQILIDVSNLEKNCKKKEIET